MERKKKITTRGNGPSLLKSTGGTQKEKEATKKGKKNVLPEKGGSNLEERTRWDYELTGKKGGA